MFADDISLFKHVKNNIQQAFITAYKDIVIMQKWSKTCPIIIIIIYSYSKNLKTNGSIKIYIYDKVVD